MNVRAVLYNGWIVLLTGLLAVAASLAYSTSAQDRFQSRGTYVIGPAAGLTQPETIVRSFDSLQGQGIVPTLVELLSSESTAQSVADRIGLDRQALERYEVRASVLSDSNTLELTVTGPSPEATAALAQGIGTSASSVFEDLYSVYQIRELDRPAVPEERFSPQPARNAVLALLLGTTVGGAVIVFRVRDGVSRPGSGAEARGPASASPTTPEPSRGGGPRAGEADVHRVRPASNRSAPASASAPAGTGPPPDAAWPARTRTASPMQTAAARPAQPSLPTLAAHRPTGPAPAPAPAPDGEAGQSGQVSTTSLAAPSSSTAAPGSSGDGGPASGQAPGDEHDAPPSPTPQTTTATVLPNPAAAQAPRDPAFVRTVPADREAEHGAGPSPSAAVAAEVPQAASGTHVASGASVRDSPHLTGWPAPGPPPGQSPSTSEIG